jgi:CO/xanthine dehydrogenase Mo-binding subunit
MLHARRVRPRGAGANTVENDTPVSIDASSIANIPGAQVVQIKDFVAVTAPKEYDAIQAAAQLKITWQTAQGFPQPSSNFWSWLRTAGDTNTINPAVYKSQTGNAPAVLASAAHTISATYHYHYNQFVPIGPHASVADVQLSQNRATVYVQAQALTGLEQTAANVINAVTGTQLPVQNVRVVWYEGSSSFGGGQTGEVNEEATILSAKLGVPVRVQWMRWDQQGWDHWGMAHMADVTIGADANGNLLGSSWVSYGQSQSNIDEDQRLLGLVSWPANPGSNGFSPTDIAVYNTVQFTGNHWVLSKTQPLYGGALKANFLRAPSAPQTFFMSEQAVDELAHAAGMDPIAFRTQNIDATTDQTSAIGILGARWLSVMNGATQAAGWMPKVANSNSQTGALRSGRGFAFGTFASSQVAIVADVQVSMKTGVITPQHLYIAQNNGVTIGPQLVTNQMSGAAIQGLSRALCEEATWNTERVTTLDWVSYPILRFMQAPSVTLINAHPGQYVTVTPGDMTANVAQGNTNAFAEGWALTGSGEPPEAAIAGAIANAFFDATGVRIRQTPMNAANVRGALKNAGALA